MNYDEVLRSILNRVRKAKTKMLEDGLFPKVIVLEDIEYQMVMNDRPGEGISTKPVSLYGIPVVPVSEAIFLPREFFDG